MTGFPRINFLALLMIVALFVASCGTTGSDQSQSGTAGSDQSESDAVQTVKVGYLHTVAVDTHMWLGMEKGFYEKHGLKLEPIKFDTGIALSQALTGGSVDVAIMGAVLSNFPAQGQGKVFLVNDVEFNTAQLWVAGDSGIESVADLKGKQVASTKGTTAHVFLHTALVEAGLGENDIEFVNSDMSGAVNAFISEAVPAVSLWVPFDMQVQELRKDAKMIDSAGNYYPDAAIVSGWVASNSFYEEKDVLEKLVLGWLDTNEYLTNNTDEALKLLHEIAYSEIPQETVFHNFEAEKTFPNDEWATLYEDGTVTRWIGQVEQVFVEIGAFDEYTPAEKFFDAQVFLDGYKKWKGQK